MKVVVIFLAIWHAVYVITPTGKRDECKNVTDKLLIICCWETRKVRKHIISCLYLYGTDQEGWIYYLKLNTKLCLIKMSLCHYNSEQVVLYQISFAMIPFLC